MNCTQFRQEIELLFGVDRLTPELQTHIESCAECAALWTEQTALAAELADGAAFDIDATEVDLLVDRVHARINTLPEERAADERKIVSISRYRRITSWVAAAAAVVAMIATGIVVEKMERPTSQTASVSQSGDYGLLSFETDDSDTTLGDTTVTVLLYDYAHARPYSASEELLTDISDEEWQYLESEFDLGGLL